MNPDRLAGRGRAVVGALLLVALAQPVFAAVEPESQVDLLRQRALQAALQADEAMAAHDGAELASTLYVGSEDRDARIVAVSVVIDELPAREQRFDDGQSRALAAGGVSELALPMIEPGEHRIRASLELRGSNADEVVTVALDERRALKGGAGALRLDLDAKTLLTPPRLRLRELHPEAEADAGGSMLGRLWPLAGGTRGDGYRIGGSGDPRVAHASYLRRTADCLDAAVLLLRMRDESAGLALPADHAQELAEALLCYGALDEAAEAVAGLPPAAAAELRLRIAGQWLERGALARARALLGPEPGRGDSALLEQWQSLQARLLLAERRYGEAAAVLRAQGNQADFDSFVRYYNFGVALLSQGFAAQGATVLDRVGSVVGINRDMMALVDRANLTLAAWFLKQGQGATAIPVLERIHSDGPYSTRAMLDLGWAWLAPAGQKQPRALLGDERTIGPPPGTIGDLNRPLVDQNIYQRYHVRPFVQAALAGDEASRLKCALAIWAELVDRDATDDAVQEGLLAVALALDRLGAHREAAGFYERAAGALQQSKAAAQAAEHYVQGERWIIDVLAADDPQSARADRALHRLPRPGVARLLSDRMAGWPFQAALAGYRDLGALDQQLGLRADRLAEAPESDGLAALRERLAGLRAQLRDCRAAVVEALRGQMLDELGQQQRLADRLLIDTRMQLARAYEQARTQQALADAAGSTAPGQ